MPKSTTKHVLLVQHPHGKGVATYPVSTHVSKESARATKTHAASLITAGDHEALKALFPSFKLPEDNKIPTDVKWATVVLPYDPALPETADEPDGFSV